MEKLTVDAEGRIIIPSEVIQKRGLRPAMNSHSLSLMKVCSFTRAVSRRKNFGVVEQTRRQAAPAHRR